jgi:hypothetical protein
MVLIETTEKKRLGIFLFHHTTDEGTFSCQKQLLPIIEFLLNYPFTVASHGNIHDNLALNTGNNNINDCFWRDHRVQIEKIIIATDMVL